MFMLVMLFCVLMMAESVVYSDISLKCVSYNCRGMNDSNRSYISNLLDHCDILFLQEHWLSNSQLDGLEDISYCCNHHALGISGFGSSDILRGRLYSRCAIFCRRS